MKDEQEPTLQQVLAEIPWPNILVPLFLALLVIVLVIFFSVRTVAQESKPSPVIPCSVKYGKTNTTLLCPDDKRLVIPRTAYRLIDCKTVNLQRDADGKLGFAENQSCHIIDSAMMIEECKKWQSSLLSYDLARNPGSLYLPDCEHWWTHVEGEQALVNVYQMRPLKQNARYAHTIRWK